MSSPAGAAAPKPVGGKGRSGLFAVVAGGGTAGHVLPALSVAEALVSRGHDRRELLFVGSRRGQEGSLVGAAGFGVVRLPGRGLLRSSGGASLVRNAASAAGLAVATLGSLKLLGRRRPAVVLCLGGYAALGPSLAALALQIPVVVANADAVPGSVNRLVGRFARASAVAWEGTPLPRSVVTGTPVRAEVASADTSQAARARARRALGVGDDRRMVLVVGGSLGSLRLNTAVADLATLWRSRADVAIHHVVGRRDWSGWQSPPAAPGGLAYRAVAYEDDMASALLAADLVVARAGASTVAELAVLGRPAVLVPLPGAPGDHQGANAAHLAAAGAAIVVQDGECDGMR
ncbi:MAG: UDP-N-acetylglucosamine--N-acetylmuramyl-(pentapeptide) pyrophosphoryl-undecaprenol N-acetylglucosamine transferase, partial [Acidimicrobiales bacterium]